MFGIKYSNKKRQIELDSGKVLIPNCIKTYPNSKECISVKHDTITVNVKGEQKTVEAYQYGINGYILFGDELFVKCWSDSQLLNDIRESLNESINNFTDNDINKFISYFEKNMPDNNYTNFTYLNSFVDSYLELRQSYRQYINTISDMMGVSVDKLHDIFNSTGNLSRLVYDIITNVINVVSNTNGINTVSLSEQIKNDNSLSENDVEIYEAIISYIDDCKMTKKEREFENKVKRIAEVIVESPKLGIILIRQNLYLRDKNNKPIIITKDIDEKIINSKDIQVARGDVQTTVLVSSGVDTESYSDIHTIELDNTSKFVSFISEYTSSKVSEQKITTGLHLSRNNPNEKTSISDMVFNNKVWDVGIAELDSNNIKNGTLDVLNGLYIDFKDIRRSKTLSNVESSILDIDEKTPLMYKELSNQQLLQDYMNFVNRMSKYKYDINHEIYAYCNKLNIRLQNFDQGNRYTKEDLGKEFVRIKKRIYSTQVENKSLDFDNSKDSEYFKQILKSIKFNPNNFKEKEFFGNLSDQNRQRRYSKSIRTKNSLKNNGIEQDDSSMLRTDTSMLDRFDVSHFGGMIFDWEFISHTGFTVDGCSDNEEYMFNSGMRDFFSHILKVIQYNGYNMPNKYDDLLDVISAPNTTISSNEMAKIIRSISEK